MKKHQHAVGREKKAIQAANKEQRRRRKLLQRQSRKLQAQWRVLNERANMEFSA